MAGVVLGLVDNQAKFYISAICGLVGFIITIIFVPGECLLPACLLSPAALLPVAACAVQLHLFLRANAVVPCACSPAAFPSPEGGRSPCMHAGVGAGGVLCLCGLLAPDLADTTNLDLMELDRYWDCILEGRKQDYHGNAINPNNLSTWERLMGRGKHFDLARDAQDRKVSYHGNDASKATA